MAPILLFDGACNLCDAAVRFVLAHERDDPPEQRLRFAALQSPAAAALLRARGVDPPPPGAAPDTMLLIDGDQVHQRSDAALRVAAHLRWPWRALRALRVVPRALRDLGYRVIARNRYRWFGVHDTCLLPTPALRARFLDAADRP